MNETAPPSITTPPRTPASVGAPADVGAFIERADARKTPWRRLEQRTIPLLVAADTLIITAILGLAPLAWELPERMPVALPLALSYLLGCYLAGGFRPSAPVSRVLALRAGIGAALGLSVAWGVLKLLSVKFGYWQLIPPASPGLVAATAGAVVATVTVRLPIIAWLRAYEAKTPVLVIGGPGADDRLRARLGAEHTHVPLVCAAPAAVPALLKATPTLRAVVLAVSPSELDRAAFTALVRLRALGVRVQTPAAFEEELCRRTPIDADDDPWFLHDDALGRPRATYLSGKRLIDILGATVLGIALAPVMLAIAVAVRATSAGPAVLSQTRTGLHTTPFQLLKFRTMRRDAEAAAGAVWADQNDPRVTRLGRLLRRTRLDELPQLWNVLRGQMSLVGPRPERPEFDAVLVAQVPFYALRHLARPGLTGWAQVRLRYASDVDATRRKIEHDLYYLKHASLAFDLRILLATIPVLLGARGR